jgi:DTW domain-containing protein YfiP
VSERAPRNGDAEGGGTAEDARERVVCARCRRPPVVCYCRHVVRLPTRTRVVLLQHPRERRVGVGTARMAHLGLPNSVLRVGTDFARDPVLAEALAPPRRACVLFPDPDAMDVSELPRDRPLTLVVLDGTWSQARKLRRLNPALAALPHVAFNPRRPSGYRIRRQPQAHCVSTIEALAEVLDALEPESGPFDRLLDPFRAVVEKQEWFAREIRSHRHHPAPRAATGEGGAGAELRRRQRLADRLAADWSRLVCVQGEANAWPRRDPARQDPEIVHWVAHRPATGETYEAVIAPRRPCAPSTPGHVGLPAARLAAGEGADSWRARWRAFSRPDDVLVSWGVFYTGLAAADGLALPARAVDLRAEAARLAPPRAGTVEACLARVAAGGGAGPPPALGLDGRGGRRLAALVHLARLLAAPPAGADHEDGDGREDGALERVA